MGNLVTLDFTTTDAQILLSVNGTKQDGYPKNYFKYVGGVSDITFTGLKGECYKLPFEKVTVDGTALTSSNYTSVLEPLFV